MSETPRLWFQIRVGEGRFGPGKAELLRHIRETGSISAAARRMDMSYRRAWTLLEAVNALTDAPAVTTERGGAKGGGASLTPRGEALLDAYETLAGELAQTAAPTLKAVATMLPADE